MRSLIYILAITIVCFSCKKDTIKGGRTVEIYLLKSYQKIQGKCQINPSSAVLEDVAIIKNDDILQYSRSAYQFKLTKLAKQKLEILDNTPYAVTVDKHVIYYGFFKPGYSSSTCENSITMDIAVLDNRMAVKLGYPSKVPGVIIDDQRNNSRLMAALKSQGKLN